MNREYFIMALEDLGLNRLIGAVITHDNLLEIINTVHKQGYEFVQILTIGMDIRVITYKNHE